METSPAKNAQEGLNGRYRGVLLAYFLRRTESYSEAEDLVQDVFVRLLDTAEEIEPRDANAYIFTVASNLLKDRHRRNAVRARFRASSEQVDGVRSDLLTPERIAISRSEVEKASAALGEISVRSREIFTLYRFEGISQREIADRFGISVSAVEKHVARALVHLNKRLNN
ncbi:MAG TPA: RNA polymerase sigma factor [Croceibacterium sp.]|nr:RNA polymerase sigma factor [Croceibacterium sp.]